MDRKRKYAKFLIEGCLRLKKNDKLFIISTNFTEDFVNLLTLEAKNMGIVDVETLINYPLKQKELYLSKPYEEIIKSPLIDRTKYNRMAKLNYAFLSLSSPLPEIFKEVDKELLAKINHYQIKSIEEYKEYQLKGLIKWNISCVPNEYWAKSLNMSVEELWELVFKICLINEDDPIDMWNKKMARLKRRAEYLNSLKIDKLIYHNSLGTNLEIGLPKDYIFESADTKNIVNMPTEEVFTSPSRVRVNGRVYSSKILIHNNEVIEDFYLEFKDGKIVEYDAVKGKDVLKDIINTDDGSHYLGEVALVDYDSPISLTNVVFKNTLYDENASCHLAIGQSFLECIKDGFTMPKEELLNKGLNQSRVHVDFFIGTRDLEVKAVLQNGEKIVIMKNGNFVEV